MKLIFTYIFLLVSTQSSLATSQLDGKVIQLDCEITVYSGGPYTCSEARKREFTETASYMIKVIEPNRIRFEALNETWGSYILRTGVHRENEFQGYQLNEEGSFFEFDDYQSTYRDNLYSVEIQQVDDILLVSTQLKQLNGFTGGACIVFTGSTTTCNGTTQQ